MALAVVLLLLAGCGSPAGPWHGRDLDETDPAWQSLGLEPRMGLELDFLREEGAELAWDWFIDERQEVHFNAHTHDDAGVTDFEDLEATDHKDTLVVPHDGVYSLVWINTSQETLTLWHRTGQELQSSQTFFL